MSGMLYPQSNVEYYLLCKYLVYCLIFHSPSYTLSNGPYSRFLAPSLPELFIWQTMHFWFALFKIHVRHLTICSLTMSISTLIHHCDAVKIHQQKQGRGLIAPVIVTTAATTTSLVHYVCISWSWYCWLVNCTQWSPYWDVTRVHERQF